MTATALQPATVTAPSDLPSNGAGYSVASRSAAANPPAFDAVDRGTFVNAMSAAVTGVNVVTTDGAAGRFGLTVSAMSSVSADPPMMLVCINRRSPACDALRMNRAFSVNVLSTRQRHLADSFAGRPACGKPYDFDDTVWTRGSAGLPCLAGATATFECALEAAYESGSHTVFIGRVMAASKGSDNPLLYTSRAYGRACQWDEDPLREHRVAPATRTAQSV